MSGGTLGRAAWQVVAMAAAALRLAAQDSIPASPPYGGVAAAVSRLIAHEMRDKGIPAVTIALVDDTTTVWAAGFGLARPRNGVPATAATVQRVGSVSKLFTDIAVMQLVERGAVDLDAPVTRYIPEFRPHDPFGVPITLRQLMTHRAGLVREPPVGSFFDSTAPPLAEVVASLNGTTLVFRPGTREKYSNAGLQVVGYVLERVTGEPFAAYLKRAVLDPLGMTRSAFFDPGSLAPEVAVGRMWAFDGRRFDAPAFRRNAPSGALYSTVVDLGRFIAALFAGGQGTNGRVIGDATLGAMWVPQFAPAGSPTGRGIGFQVSELDGHRQVGHDGALYGFSSTLAALPDDRLGVVVVATMNESNVVTDRIAAFALRALLAQRSAHELPAPDTTAPFPPGLARRIAGHYRRGSRAADLLERQGELFLGREGTAIPSRIMAHGDSLTFDDYSTFGGSIHLAAGSVIPGSDTLRSASEPFPREAPSRWREALGEYGWDYETLFLFERGGRLHALIEWVEDAVLQRVSDSTFAFPATSMYAGERLTVHRDRAGRATGVTAGAVRFPRRTTGPAEGGQLHVTPLAPVADLLVAARAAVPPAESGDFRPPDLVAVTALDSEIRLEIRYATTNNFLGSPFYSSARAFLQRPAALAVVQANRRLRSLGYGLLVHDAYRPWYVTKTFWDATPPASRWMVANPARGSRHNRGCAVDLTLFDLRTGRPVDMGGTYDEATERSFPDYPVTTDRQRWLRELLRQAMEAEGFTRNADEWWHFDYQDWRSYPILNVTFEEIAQP